jgi:transcription antitermination factor NusG
MSTCINQVLGSEVETAPEARLWHVVTTMPRHEKTTWAGLTKIGIDAFLPTYESVRSWRNRQKVAVVAPLFPTYLFVRITPNEKLNVLRTPGVRQFVGNRQGLAVIPSEELEGLRRAVSERKALPFEGLVEGSRVRVRSGPLQGIEGCLLRKSNECRIVVKVRLINQHAVIDVDASDIEPLDETDLSLGQRM